MLGNFYAGSPVLDVNRYLYHFFKSYFLLIFHYTRQKDINAI